MIENSRKNILISAPSPSNDRLCLPYIWAVLQTYCNNIDGLSDRLNWLDPIYQKGEISYLFKPYGNLSPDVVGLSCYIWNFDIQIQIGKYVKEYYPQCLVVAGGPHLDYRNSDFFMKYPYIDIVVIQDGEISFSKILTKLVLGDNNFSDIPGLCIRTSDGKDSFLTGSAELPRGFDHSPYLEYSSYFEKLIRHYSDGTFNAVWETNRGCPYGCTYCAWGTNTLAKIRKIPIERVKSEADWFGKMKIHLVELTDANFGILHRDVEITDFIIAAYNKYNYPKGFIYGGSKNNPNRNIEISKKVSGSGIRSVHHLSVQHTSEKVLKSIGRGNISVEKQREVLIALKEAGMPIMVEILLGLPGDSYEEWKACLGTLMEWGIHDKYMFLPFILLPNSPAAEKSYMEEFKIETVDSVVPTNMSAAGRIKKDISTNLVKGRMVIKTATFSRDEWVKIKVYASFINALHNCGLTQVIAFYLRFTYNISYKQFYESVIEHFADSGDLGNELYRAIMTSNQELLTDKNALEFLELKQIPEFPYLLEGYQWIFVQVCFNFNRFFGELTELLLEKYAFVTHLRSAIDYQKNIVILPDYDMEKGKVFPIDLNWVQYSKKAKTLTKFEPMPEPSPVNEALVEVKDKVCGDNTATFPLTWNVEEGQVDWTGWMEKTLLWHRSSNRTNFQNLSLQIKSVLRID